MTKRSEFTPGDWTVERRESPTGDDGVSLLQVAIKAEDRYIAWMSIGDATANANVMAAAKDLYEALDELLAFVEASVDDLDAAESARNPECSYSISDALSLEQARAALAKARGEQGET